MTAYIYADVVYKQIALKGLPRQEIPGNINHFPFHLTAKVHRNLARFLIPHGYVFVKRGLDDCHIYIDNDCRQIRLYRTWLVTTHTLPNLICTLEHDEITIKGILGLDGKEITYR